MNDLHELLRRTGDDLTLDRPLDAVTGRGAQLRRRRRTARAGLLGAAAAAVAVGAVAVIPIVTGEEPTRHDDVAGGTGTAGWASPILGIPDDEAAHYEQLCRDGGNAMVERFPRSRTDIYESAPVASNVVDGPDGQLAVLVYHHDGAFADCVVDADAQREPSVLTARSFGTLEPRGEHVTSAGTYGSSDLSIAAGIVSPDVSTVRITLDGEVIDAAVGGGVFVSLVPPSASRELLLAATVEALDAGGAVLETVPLVRG